MFICISGVSLAWFGGYTLQMSRTPATGSYSIDGGPPIEFPLTGPPQGTKAFYRTKLFETPELSSGSHVIEVNYKGGSTSAPLTLWQAYVNHGTLKGGVLAANNPGGSSGNVGISANDSLPEADGKVSLIEPKHRGYSRWCPCWRILPHHRRTRALHYST